MKRALFIFSIVLLGLISCKKTEESDVDMGYEYYPVQQGSFVEYEVEHITYDDFQDPVKIDTFLYWIREVQDTSFLDNAGRTSNLLLRYRRDSLNGTWNLERRWYFTKLPDRLERVEENIRTIHLEFPVTTGQTWNGNLYNENPTMFFRTARSGYTAEVNGEIYSNSCQIILENNINLIEQQYGEEIYSKGIGKIYKEQVDLKTTFEGEIRSGFEMRMKVVDYGNI